MTQNRYLLPAAAFAMFLAGCTPSNSAQPGAKVKAAESGGVATAAPTKKTLRVRIEQPASVEAFEETPLVARIPGYIEKVNADIGQVVKGPRFDAKGQLAKPGDVLAELSVPEMLRELEQKQALVTQARAEVDQAAASLDAADANVLTAKAQVREAEAARARALANYDRWKSEFARVDKLVKDKVVDEQIRDETLNQFKSADANRQEVEAKVQSAQALAKESEAKRAKAKADVAASKARVLVALAEEGRLKALAEYRHIRAPFDGVVTRRNVHTGHFLQPNAAGAPSVLFIVARTDKLRIVADIPETEAMYISDKLAAKIQSPVLKEQSFDANVTRTSWTLDAKSRTLRIEIDFANEDAKLRPGMFANVFFTIPLEGRYTLPASAIFTHADLPCCWRVVEGKAVRTPLKLGVRDGQDVEILKMQHAASAWQAVTGQEEVVISNLGTVSEGKEVRVERK